MKGASLLYWAIWVFAALAGIVVLLIAVIWSIRRRRNVVLQVHNTAGIEQLLPSVAGLSLGVALPGNSVELLENGSYFDVLLARIGAARHSVHFETFLWKEGSIGRRLGEALAKQARSGCQVRVLLDASGSRHMGSATLARMREGGCQVVFFHDGAFRNIGLLNDRDHRKLAVVDGREAIVGGHCIVDGWLGDAEDHQHYADVSVRVQGPIVNILQGAFSENWISESAEVFSGDEYFPRAPDAGKIWMHAVYLKPEGSTPPSISCITRRFTWRASESGSRTRI